MNTSTSLKIAVGAGALAFVLIGFIGGQLFERAHLRHELHWRDNYQQNFHAHGILGKILSVSADKKMLTVQDKGGTEQSIATTDTTVIHGELTVGATVAVFGHPNGQGQIEADLIRLFPTP